MTKSERDSASSSYRNSGVDVQAGYDAVRLMREHVARTITPGVIGGLGGFGGMFELPAGMRRPVLVSGTDGVGTKLKIAFTMNVHDTVGIDCVAMCANDVLCCGATPLFFLDYVAVGKNVPERVAGIVSGVAEGCVRAGCALIGGETAEMPGFYPENEYDIAGFCVGAVERDEILDPVNVKAGDIVIALPSSGVHSNGFSLVRKVFVGHDMKEYVPELGRTLGEELLTPTRIYVKEVLPIISRVKSIAHITGGGFWENIPRALPGGLAAKIDLSAIRVPPIFDLIMRTGNIPLEEMYHVFNMGAGMMLIVGRDEADYVAGAVDGACVAGEIVEGEGGLLLC
ncbi:MAG: phosphoribosylformylglycinamidine cyclo-ligase [Synergistaceae bacterium]|nr:phosphoribosylformylglycinamidine cyclo-ligase [Synergistaceae bacterium]